MQSEVSPAATKPDLVQKSRNREPSMALRLADGRLPLGALFVDELFASVRRDYPERDIVRRTPQLPEPRV